jgi:hypothetical protein
MGSSKAADVACLAVFDPDTNIATLSQIYNMIKWVKSGFISQCAPGRRNLILRSVEL